MLTLFFLSDNILKLSQGSVVLYFGLKKYIRTQVFGTFLSVEGSGMKNHGDLSFIICFKWLCLLLSLDHYDH